LNLLRAATLVVPDPEATAARYAQWLDYRVVERGPVPVQLAAAWGGPGSARKNYLVLAPASGAEIYLRLVAGDTPPDYRPLRSFGWAAIEVCVSDLVAVNERMLRSPFTIISPPRERGGLPALLRMQLRGPDQEIVFLTQSRADLADHDLAQAESLIDKLCILVLACSDLRTSLAWFERKFGLRSGGERETTDKVLSDAFGLLPEEKYRLATLSHGRDLFFELDQYPAQTAARTRLPGQLPPGIAIATLQHPDLAGIDGPWLTPPRVRNGVIYGGRASGVLSAPDGALVEIVATA
jgi:catechol 2,3-dioxygenase-like lactoylglutathione lyase family enzyme